jgi:Icc-related predicted phosphoesterase
MVHMPRIVCISDTHTRHEEVEMPPGDILVHAGDLTDLGAETDVLITHGPPAGIGAATPRGDHVGCADLLAAVRRIGPRLHVFGHIHEGYGRSSGARRPS